MNWTTLEKKLITAARAKPPSDRVPYAFEQRVMAQLKSRDHLDEWAWWIRALWVSAGACAAVALATCVWSFRANEGAEAWNSFSHGFEQTLFASAEHPENAW